MIETARLVLEKLQPEHAAFMLPGLSDPRGYAFIPDEPPASLAMLEARYERLEAGASPDGRQIWLNWAIKRKHLLDYIGFVQATIMPEEAAMLTAYHIFPSFWGQGFGREAVAAMLEHCRITHHLAEARAYIDSRNLKSLRLVEALGFVPIELIKNADFFHGRVSDEFFYRLDLQATAPTKF